MNEYIPTSSFGVCLLKISQLDLESARCLYGHRCYPQAVFSLQQSVEKGAKSYALLFGLITEKMAKESVRHQSLKVFEDSIKKVIKDIDLMREPTRDSPNMIKSSRIACLPQAENELEKTLKEIQTFSKVDGNYRILSMDRIKDCLSTLNQFFTERQEIAKTAILSDISEREYNIYKNNQLRFVKRLFKDEPEKLNISTKNFDGVLKIKEISKELKEIMLEMVDPWYLSNSFFILSKILQPHAIASRYPDGNQNPLEIYTTNLPLILEFSSFCAIHERTLAVLVQQYEQK